MRALYTSASGLAAQQARLDAIANNLANLNTTGYKAQDVQFKDILYAQYQQRPEIGQINDAAFPRQSTLGLRIGQGIWAAQMTQLFTQGTLQQTGNLTDLAIEGNGFFKVATQVDASGNPTEVAYTRDGSFKVANKGDAQNPQLILTDAAGHPVLDANNREIDLTGYDLTSLQVGANGTITAKQPGGAPQQVGQINLVEIAHPETNLKPAGGNLYALNTAAQNVVTNQAYNAPDRPTIKQGFVEQSNVDMGSMMSEMMESQRIYSMNARALSTTDQMMSLANNLRT